MHFELPSGTRGLYEGKLIRPRQAEGEGEMTDLRDGRNIGAGALLTGKLGSFWICGNDNQGSGHSRCDLLFSKCLR
jgi:hypothetical protein